ncbi:hypothetical exported protein [Taylorella equigenitalis 14/56]|uniref:Lipoprotein n=3 Tax=Taylorella equigenitalis TaxID=29575 RepID=A0A654KIA6_TAYEM|nr:hypothetical protein TEQUI_1273 [Taylorella equigenitalis MCE9]AFN35752.1 putative exported protein [Taylorella equigenitalis ATCC 35865]CCG17849.1 hypothetical exported protein [Taylorella equigenitalis 14/56]VEG30791.1 Uncharacterised protein [Taylorella equigenitalis ATCC 35865]
MFRKLSFIALFMCLSACAMKDERPAVPKDVPPPNHLYGQ